MAGKAFVFVQALPLGRTKREQELEQAKARSHAAKVVHRRGKEAHLGSQRLITEPAKKHGLESREGMAQETSDEDVAVSTKVYLGVPTKNMAQHNSWNIPREHQKTIFRQKWLANPGLIPAFLALRQGNSDPFGAFPVAVSSQVNAYMTYTRELYLPGMVRDTLNPEGAIESGQEWVESVGALNNSVTIYAHLARIAAAMMVFDQDSQRSDFANQLLVFKSKGTKLLRQRIESGVVDDRTALAMSCLHLAAVHAREYAVARTHARALIQLFRQGDVPVDLAILQRTVAMDGQLASRTLERPLSFDVEEWTLDEVNKGFKPLVDALPPFMSLDAMSQGLDEALEGKLREVQTKLRRGLVLSMLLAQDLTFATYDVKQFIRWTVNSSHMILVNLYQDAKASLDQPLDATRGKMHVQAYASLATILWVRKVTGASASGIEGTPVVIFKYLHLQADAPSGFVDANAFLMDRLKQELTESAWMVSDAELRKKCASTRLWALYVGAYLEQVDVASAGSHRSASRDWFNVQLALQASAMGLVTWQQVCELLLGFLHADMLMPHGSTWFIHTFEANRVDAVTGGPPV